MLRWNGTIAQEQDQPVFKNRHQAGREAPQVQAEPRNRIDSQCVGFASCCPRGMAFTRWADRMFSTCPPPQGHQLIMRHPLSGKVIRGEACRLIASVEPTHAQEPTDPLSGSGTSFVRGLGISLPMHGIDSRIGWRIFEGNSRGAVRKRAPGVPNARL